MPVVVDASLLVRLASGGALHAEIGEHLAVAIRDRVDLHAPALMPYELESAVRSLVFANEISESAALAGLAAVGDLPITLHLHPGNGVILRMAGRRVPGRHTPPPTSRSPTISPPSCGPSTAGSQTTRRDSESSSGTSDPD